MTNNESPTMTNNRETPLDTDPLNLAFLLGTIRPQPFLRPKTNTIYIHSKTKNRPFSPSMGATGTSGVGIEELSPPLPPSNFSEKEKEAWLWFWKKGAALGPLFSAKSLQKEFRRLALGLHPDQNHHPRAAELFLQLREHYNTLMDQCHKNSKASTSSPFQQNP